MKTTLAQREAAQRWREKNKEKVKAQQKAYCEKVASDPRLLERRRLTAQRYYYLHRDTAHAASAAYRATPQGRMADRLRSRLRAAYKHGLTSSIEALLHCSLAHFRAHIASQWEPDMNRSNYGIVWELDHIKPCAAFDLTQESEQHACFDHRNIRPMRKRANKIKHAKA